MAILDQYGRPIATQQLREPQTARVAGLQNEFAGHPSRGLTPAKLAAILEEAEQGNLIRQAELGLDMEEKDGHIHAELGKRRRALLGLEWSIAPPRNPSAAEQAAADQLAELVQDIRDIEDVILDLADAIGHGYACLEYEWQRLGATWLPGKITHRPPTWFTTPPTRQNELRLRDGSAEGAELQPFGWLVHVHKAKPGYITRGGLHRVLSWPYLFKNYSVRDLAEFLEIYGLPLRLGTYQPGASDAEKSTLLRAVVGIGHAAAGIVPEGMKIDFETASDGASDPFMAMMDWCERTQSKAILGQTLSAEASPTGLGSGVATLQGEVRRDILVSDARQLASTLSRDLLYPLAVLNGARLDGPLRAPQWVFATQEPEDLKLYSEALPKLVGLGMRIPRQWAHERLQIPLADGTDAVLVAGAPAAPVPLAGLRALQAALSATGARPTTARQADRLSVDAAPAVDGWVESLRTLAGEVADLAELRDRVIELSTQIDTAELGDVMAWALAAAELAGRADIMDEAGGRS